MANTVLGRIFTGGSGSGGGSGTPGGSNTQVQFNDSNAFAGDAGLTYNKTTDKLTVVGEVYSGGINATAAVKLYMYNNFI